MNPTETLPKPALTSGGRMLIGSDWREAQSGKRFKTVNPATGDTLLEVAEGDAADIDLAVQAARRAFEGPWGKMSASERGRLLWKLGDLINEKTAELAQLETLDTGKPIREAIDDVGRELGKEGVEDFPEKKSVYVNLGE